METMNKMMVVVMGFLFVGCAHEQKCPQIPDTACNQCYMQMKDSAENTVSTSAVLLANGTDAFLEFLQKSEQYLQEKIEQWKIDHPELVTEGEQQLAALHQKIENYKRVAMEVVNGEKKHE